MGTVLSISIITCLYLREYWIEININISSAPDRLGADLDNYIGNPPSQNKYKKPQTLMFNNDLPHAQLISEKCKTYSKAVLYTTVPDIHFSMFGPANGVIQAWFENNC